MALGFGFSFQKVSGILKTGSGGSRLSMGNEKNRKLIGGRVSSGFSRELEMLFWTVLDIG